MIVVTGCPRSGTSLTMLLMQSILGEDRILGHKFPQLVRREQQKGETDRQFELRRYLASLNPREEEGDDRFIDMNPNGFWECQYSVQGIKYNFSDRKNLEKYLNETDENRTCVKIVSQGLLPSDPKYITKLIYLIRHPRSVAKSQERLKRGFDVTTRNGENVNIYDDFVVHTPEMYINVTTQASRFLLLNPEIDVHFLYYDDLIENPKEEVKKICKFINQDFKQAWKNCKDIVNPKLRRSIPQDIENRLWPDAEAIFERFCNKDYRGVLDYMQDQTIEYHKEVTNWQCLRTGDVANDIICKQCIGSKEVRKNFRQKAEDRGIDWRNRPCMYECNYNFDLTEENLITVTESIENNIWAKEADEPVEYDFGPVLGSDAPLTLED
jgi:hypothetical protein